MKKLAVVAFIASFLIFGFTSNAQISAPALMSVNLVSARLLVHSAAAESMAENTAGGDHTAKEEAEGKEVWEKFQSKQIVCGDLTEGDFGALGEYFMGQMLGSSHSAMNNMMIQMMGEKGEEEMHVVLGKRLSGCDASARFSGGALGLTPMMTMMSGGMMAGGALGLSSLGWLGWIFMALWWVLIIIGLVVIVKWILIIAGLLVPIKWIVDLGKGGINKKSALNILKERYARGEINKAEFEEKKRDLG